MQSHHAFTPTRPQRGNALAQGMSAPTQQHHQSPKHTNHAQCTPGVPARETALRTAKELEATLSSCSWCNPSHTRPGTRNPSPPRGYRAPANRRQQTGPLALPCPTRPQHATRQTPRQAASCELVQRSENANGLMVHVMQRTQTQPRKRWQTRPSARVACVLCSKPRRAFLCAHRAARPTYTLHAH